MGRSIFFVEVTTHQIIRIGKLARIRIEPQDIPALQEELSGILHWVDQLEKVDIRGMQSFTDCLTNSVPEREDEVTDGNCVKAILANAPDKAHDMFCVPKVV
jgi:aspartyl-tRNA(Asn)/glutamyl-tRNA(Gln) amidotransferase subunit C